MTTPKIDNQLFRKDASVPGGYLVSLPGMLLLSAGAAYDTDGDVTPEGKARGLRMVNTIPPPHPATVPGFCFGPLKKRLPVLPLPAAVQAANIAPSPAKEATQDDEREPRHIYHG